MNSMSSKVIRREVYMLIKDLFGLSKDLFGINRPAAAAKSPAYISLLQHLEAF